MAEQTDLSKPDGLNNAMEADKKNPKQISLTELIMSLIKGKKEQDRVKLVDAMA